MKPYTVVLLYPIINEDKQEAYINWTHAADEEEAERIVRGMAVADNGGGFDADDFYCIAVLHGELVE